MKVTVDDSCTGCGLCVDACPAVFELGDDGVAKVKLDQAPDDLQDACREAAEACPVDAISLQD